ncbi:hypothetical protein L227DRAFT_571780 [Lentinus tigrinus ALCF2SS1-6]|nr:hypothetical protein L227DRAFT_571780 [Lentinus tigrinus ALCF2SS1-6]
MLTYLYHPTRPPDPLVVCHDGRGLLFGLSPSLPPHSPAKPLTPHSRRGRRRPQPLFMSVAWLPVFGHRLRERLP